MTVDITVPALGESVTEATVMRWNKAPGDAVAVDETLVELETDKIAVEVKAEAAGTLAEIAAVEGTDVEVGALLGRLETGEGAATAAAEPRVGEASDAPATVAARETALETISARPTVPPPFTRRAASPRRARPRSSADRRHWQGRPPLEERRARRGCCTCRIGRDADSWA